MSEPVRIRNAALEVAIDPVGAQIVSIRDAQGAQWLWPGDPAIWPRQAPTLFPVVAQVHGSQVRHDGRAYPMRPHGFAPTASFAPARTGPASCRMTLAASEETRASYPFEFRLDIDYALAGSRLEIVARVANEGERPMPFAFGLHPGFAWPLPTSGDAPKEEHVLVFSAEEAASARRTSAEGLLPEPDPIPLRDRRLRLDETLFARDALIFDRLASRSIWYGAPGRSGVAVELGDMPYLGVWSRAPGRFLCLEPWQGLPDPKGYTGELRDKPGMLTVAPGESAQLRCAFGFGIACALT